MPASTRPESARSRARRGDLKPCLSDCREGGRRERIEEIKLAAAAALPRRRRQDSANSFGKLFQGIGKAASCASVIENRRRIDGARFKRVSPSTCEWAYLPPPRTAARCFTRGETRGFVITRWHRAGRAVRRLAGGHLQAAFHAALQFPALFGREVGRMYRRWTARIGHGKARFAPIQSAAPGQDDVSYTIVSSRRSRNQTVRPRWRRSAVPRSRSWMQACR